MPELAVSRPIEFEMSRKQHAALQLLNAPHPSEVFMLLYGGAKGGGKTVFLCEWAFVKALDIAIEYCLPPTKDLRKIPVIGYIGRKRGVDFNSSTLLTWKRFIPGDRYELRLLEGKVPIIVIDHRVALMYGGMDNTDLINKFNSAEFMFVAVDQAEEISEDDQAKLRGSLRLQLRVKGIQRAPGAGYKVLFSANPAECWLKRVFINPRSKQANTAYLQALPSDNPFLPDGYIENLRQTYAFNPALLRAYLEGSWDDLDQAMVVIPRRRMELCVNNKLVSTRQLKKLTVADIAGESEGADESVIGNFINESLVSWEIYSHRDLMDTAGRIIAHATKHGSNTIVIDKVGEGSGVYSRVREVHADNRKMRVHGFDGRISPPDGIPAQTYVNYKSYAWFNASKGVIAERRCSILPDEELVRQLCGVTYHFTSGGKLIIDSKEKLNDQLGCSPDRADMFIMGLDGLQYAQVIQKRDEWSDDDKVDYKWSPDSV